MWNWTNYPIDLRTLRICMRCGSPFVSEQCEDCELWYCEDCLEMHDCELAEKEHRKTMFENSHEKIIKRYRELFRELSDHDKQ
jgi:hypothetical protein